MTPQDVRKVATGFIAGLIGGGAIFALMFPNMPLGVQMAIGCIVIVGCGFLGALTTAMFFHSEEA